MKDIYELLNEININESEFEEMYVSENEKRKMKKTLKRNIQKKRPSRLKRAFVTAAIIGGLSLVTLSLTFPTYASNIPLIHDIFTLFSKNYDGLYENYKEHASELNMTKESNGIKMTIKDAIYDGKTVTATFLLESETDLGEHVELSEWMEIKKLTETNLSIYMENSKIGEHQYAGLIEMTILDQEEIRKPTVTWNIRSIRNSETMEEIKGRWDFTFSVEETNHTVLNVYENSRKGGVQVQVERIKHTPMSTVIYYHHESEKELMSTWEMLDIELEVKDDLGHVYTVQPNGGIGTDYHNMNWTITFGKIDPAASKLIITPRGRLSNFNFEQPEQVESRYEQDGVEYSEVEATVTETEASNYEYEEMLFDEIVIELEK
ncbi:DUF4179 domain-containing protein [Alkalihalobacillus sp. LMS39]|uniref:DUF4179 domain-containing protein n=1 Tax=Alkalihalobacillus sp. LMS39 TaxID=2924032 RepID=UPI001FB559BC|nr:DUF4179 domain-containing protein [Alkalihalobacillus sp. LMS39]UOE94515.1 DUF4179 domain-containing protein [Alkalihalobacillus sp. LMS39]